MRAQMLAQAHHRHARTTRTPVHLRRNFDVVLQGGNDAVSNMLTELVELHRLCVDMDLGPGFAPARALIVTCSFFRVSTHRHASCA